MKRVVETVFMIALGALAAHGLIALAGCASSGYAKHTVSALGSTFSYEINHYKGDAKPAEGEAGKALLSFDREGVDILGGFIDALRGPEDEKAGDTEAGDGNTP